MALVTWYMGDPAEYRTPTSGVYTDLLSRLNTLIVAQSASASAYWEVAEYKSSSPQSILLRRKNNAAGRIVIFGNGTNSPNASAVKGTPTASGTYIGYSATSTVNTCSDWTAGAPLAAADYMPGVLAAAPATGQEYQLSVIEHTDGLLFWLSRWGSGFQFGGAGELIEDVSGTAYPMIFGGGSGETTSWSVVSTTGNLAFINPVIGTDASYSTANACLVVRSSGANRQMFRMFAISGTATNSLHKFEDRSTNRAHYFPIWITTNTGDAAGIFGKLRQIAFGPITGRYAKRPTAGSPPNATEAYALGYGWLPGNLRPHPVWFTNFEV